GPAAAAAPVRRRRRCVRPDWRHARGVSRLCPGDPRPSAAAAGGNTSLTACGPGRSIASGGGDGLTMKIAIGSDHRGFEAKRRLLNTLHSLGHEVVDVGTTEADSVDYPDFAVAVGRRVRTGAAD